jgi:hypothetical protein
VMLGVGRHDRRQLLGTFPIAGQRDLQNIRPFCYSAAQAMPGKTTAIKQCPEGSGQLWRLRTEESVHEAHRCREEIYLVAGPIPKQLA